MWESIVNPAGGQEMESESVNIKVSVELSLYCTDLETDSRCQKPRQLVNGH